MDDPQSKFRNPRIILRLLLTVLIPVFIASSALLYHFLTATAAGVLEVTILASYNLVVDSNVQSPSTFAPSVATVAVKYCNNGDQPLTNVFGHIGNYDPATPSNSTPGIYPTRTTDSGFLAQHPLLNTPATYSFTHLGGQTGTRDATRFIGTLAAGECNVQYWHFTYPHCEANQTPPCTGDPVWGASNDPDDDLWLQFDAWGTSEEDADKYATWTMTMRNEISAMANKIEPNPDGAWFNTKSDVIRPGEIITSNGILYELGNINQGFDNDGDYLYDYNAWMQPIGDAGYDPSCFRLIRTSGVLTITRSGGLPPLILPFEDQLYFTKIPENNTGVTGNVYYTFMALGGPCTTAMSPYQEVASGADNEKFNADFGTGIPPIVSLSSKILIDKSSSPNVVTAGNQIVYTIPFWNDGDESAGLTMSTGGVNMPVVISDTIPAGTQFVSASYSLGYTPSDPNNGVTILYSTNNGATWTTTVPSPASSVTNVQWWLNDPLPKTPVGSSTATLTVFVPSTPSTPAYIENTACASLGGGANLVCDDDGTLVSGNNRIGDRVWRDEDLDGIQDAGEGNIEKILISLYWDADGDGILDSDDLPITTTTTNALGIYGFFNLPDGRFLVVVDDKDSDLPRGYRETTKTTFAVALDPTHADSNPVINTTTDFGFGPSLKTTKKFVGGVGYEGRTVSYLISVQNLRPGGGEPVGNYCRYSTWATTEDADTAVLNATKRWSDSIYAFSAEGPDASYAWTDYTNAINNIEGTGFTLAQQSAGITKVEAVFSIFVEGTLVDDYTDGYLYFNGSQIAYTTFTPAMLNALGPSEANKGLLVWDVTSPRTWAWSDFTGDLDLRLVSLKVGGKDGATIHLDAIGFRVTNNTSCPPADPSDVLFTVPLTDTYNTTYLQFVSADPPQSSYNSTTGLITWNNIGPIYPGTSQSVRVNFLAIGPTGVTTTTVSNTTCATNSLFADGGYANNSCATEIGKLEPTGLISGVVWSDLGTLGWVNPIGYVSGTDRFIPNVTIKLYQCVGLPTTPDTNKTCVGNGGEWLVVATTTTDAAGKYLFDNMPRGYYYVEVMQGTIPGTTSQTGDPDSTPGQCTGGACDNLWEAPGDKLQDINNLTYSETIINKNFGYTVPPSIFGTVWQDMDGDGTRDTGDNGMGNATSYVRVVLRDCGANNICEATDSTTSTYTNINGYYQFTNLTAGRTYRIEVDTSTLPAGGTWAQTFDPDATIDSRYTVMTIQAGQVSGSWDFGYHHSGTYSIGDTVYADWNGNGVQNSGEEGLSGIPVQLYEDSNGNGVIDPSTDALIASTATNSTGWYSFSGLVTGTYIVKVTDSALAGLWDNYKQTQDPDQPGVCTICDSKAKVSLTALNPNPTNIDFGYHPFGTASIGELVWKDIDGDGIYDPNEPGIPGQLVSLYEDTDGNGILDGNDALVMTTTTSVTGTYTFSKLPAGEYLVIVNPTTTVDGKTYVISTDNSPMPVTLTTGQIFKDANFGYTTGGIVGDYIWQDNNGDGTPSAGEPGIPNVTVQLYTDINKNGKYDSGTDMLYASTSTNASGYYTFTGVISDTYVVRVVTTTLPSSGAGWYQTGDPDARAVPCVSDSGIEPNVLLRCNSQSAFDLTAGQVDRSHDFGYLPPAGIGDFVWWDIDGDGIQDPGEPGISGVVVTLTLPGGGGTLTTVTDLDGYYSFGNLANSSGYTISAATPSGMVSTYDGDSTLNGSTSFNITSGAVSEIGSTPCSSCNLNLDFGFKYTSTYAISGTVFFDLGGTGDTLTDTYSTGDTPYQGIRVFLWDANGNVVMTTTNSSGAYSFPNLPTGTYTVSVEYNSPTLNGMALTASPNGSSSPNFGKSLTTVVITAASVSNIDFGYNALIDFGDLLNIYHTLVSSEGAGHITSSLYLGTSVNTESDGQPDAAANLDNYDDGITRYGIWNAGETVYIKAYVTGNNGYLVGYFDWNGDGDFTDPGEIRLFGDVASGDNFFQLTLPALSGSISARFRLYDKTEMTFVSQTGLATGGEVEDYYWPLGPTAITLMYMDVAPAWGNVLLTWQTSLEVNSIGFNVYRSTSLNEPYVQVNEQLIPSNIFGGPLQVYEFMDTNVVSGVTYYYWLEAIDIEGKQIYGPVPITLHFVYAPIIIKP